jgi:DNA cross-link repair 1B protein
LIKEINEVADEYAIELEMGMTHMMSLGEDESFNVTLIDANHCPGAIMYLFEGYFGHVLATGIIILIFYLRKM